MQNDHFGDVKYFEGAGELRTHYNPANLVDVLGIIARARGMTEIATKAGVTREALYTALSKTGAPNCQHCSVFCAHLA